MKKVVVIGAGGIAEEHLKALTTIDSLEVVGIADTNLERAKEVAERYRLMYFQSYHNMVEQLRPEIAIITLPHFLHKEAAVFCADSGCHLLMEKPLAISSQHCVEIIEAVNRNQVIMLVGQTQQYISQILTAKSLIKSNPLGTLISIQENRHTPYFTEQRPAWFLEKSKSGGGIMFNLGNHCIDKLQWLTDSRMSRVQASLSYHADYPEMEASAVILMHTTAGVPCLVNLSGYEGIKGEETVLTFTKGMLKIINHQAVYISINGKYEAVPNPPSKNPFELQIRDLLNCIQEKRQPYASGDYAYSVVRAVEAVYASHLTAKEIII